jgi:hypothetical protein
VVGGETATKVDRVLDVRQGQLCWVAGTVYMEMPLKPSVLEDISNDVSANTLLPYTAVTPELTPASAGLPLPPRPTSITPLMAANQ